MWGLHPQPCACKADMLTNLLKVWTTNQVASSLLHSDRNITKVCLGRNNFITALESQV